MACIGGGMSLCRDAGVVPGGVRRRRRGERRYRVGKDEGNVLDSVPSRVSPRYPRGVKNLRGIWGVVSEVRGGVAPDVLLTSSRGGERCLYVPPGSGDQQASPSSPGGAYTLPTGVGKPAIVVVTMRGAERPGKVKWNRPFLPPLEPLSPSASRQIFIEVADKPGDAEELVLDNLLDLSGHLPLAVSLMANIASFEGYSTTLARWQIENTALLSQGKNKQSNLEKSISLSFNSPRISSSLDAKNLLSLLSVLPDGIRSRDIIAGKVPIPDVCQCQSLLVRTSLAYVDVKGRLKTLSPVAEYIRRVHPPSLSVSQPLRTYFQDLLELWRSKCQLPSGILAPELAGNLGNINQLILEALSTEDKSTWAVIGQNIITLNYFSMVMLIGDIPLFQRLPHLIEVTGDAALRWEYVTLILKTPSYQWNQTPEVLIEQGLQHFNAGSHPVGLAGSFYDAVARYYTTYPHMNLSRATQVNRRALALAEQGHDIDGHLTALLREQHIALECHDPRRAIEVGEKARKIEGLNSSSCGGFDWISNEAWAHTSLGNLSQALSLCTQAEEHLTSVGMEVSEKYLRVLNMHAEVHCLKTEYLEACQIHTQIVKMTSPTCSPWFHANALCSIVQMELLMEDELTDIVSNLNAVEEVYRSLSSPRTILCSWLSAELELYYGNTANARAQFLECFSKTRGPIYPDITQVCLAALSEPAHRMHGTMETFCWAVLSLSFAQKLKDTVATINALRRLADVYSIVEDEDNALSLFHAALEAGTRIGIHRLRARCMVGIGDIMLHRGDSTQAKKMWEAAQPLFICSSRMKDAAAIKTRVEQLSQTQVNSPPLQPLPHRGIHNSTLDSADSDTHIQESSFEMLELLSAPNASPSLRTEVPVGAQTKTDSKTKPPAQ
ncbi:hypothetical protein DFH08DRAFT_822096 [Mycena albidolilacea]|uniref:Uncharacterized protein n=1 Tax=Mycena albidolilacea TaxID=1033008 RepID=A0AAD6Z996_9AGAR|nr:hypothetical protein DFH08DRAFT_822096 [Mycena albidolilacea]